MRYMDNLREKLLLELEELSEHTLGKAELDTIDKLAHAVKCLDTIEAMEGYSEGRARKGRTPSRSREEIRGKLEELMTDADDTTRQELQRLIDKM